MGNKMRPKDTYRIVIIGDSGVGKSSLLSQFVYNRFVEEYITTIGIDVGFKRVAIPTSNGESKDVLLRLFDTGGQKRFETITEHYQASSTDGLVVVFDVTDITTFERVKILIRRAKEISPLGDSLPILLVGNKIDLAKLRCVSVTEVETLIQNEACAYIETSAKENQKVQEIFSTILDLILENQLLEVEEEKVEFSVNKRNRANVRNFKTQVFEWLLWFVCIKT